MAKTSARRWPAASRPPMISSAVALRPSGSFCPMCVWASNHATSRRSSRPSRYTGSRRSSKVLPLIGKARLTLALGGERVGGGAELGPQLRQAEPDPALGGAQRHAGPARDLVGGQAAPVGEDDRLALGVRQRAQGRAHGAPLA